VLTRTADGVLTRFYRHQALRLAPIVEEYATPVDRPTAPGVFALRHYYVWTPGGQLLYLIDASSGIKVYFYHFDRLGSTVALTDAAGTVTDAYAYDPYGRLREHTGSSSQPFTFVGQWGVRQEGAEGDLYHMRARYYDAATGRFLSRDPAWPAIGDPARVNPYTYATNDPLNQVDIRGTESSDEELISALLVGNNPWVSSI